MVAEIAEEASSVANRSEKTDRVIIANGGIFESLLDGTSKGS